MGGPPMPRTFYHSSLYRANADVIGIMSGPFMPNGLILTPVQGLTDAH